jgi:ribosomal protein S18 acetylase RimI-like enzyme
VPLMTLELVPLSLDDVEVVHAITSASERADRVPYVTTIGELRETFAQPDLDLEQDVRVALLDDRPAGLAMVETSPSGARLEGATLFGWVHPDHRRRGVGSRLLAWQIDRGRERLAGAVAQRPCYLRTFHYRRQQTAIDLCVAHGMVPVRWFDELIRPVAPAVDIGVPDGVDIIGWDDRRRGELLDVRNAAFADHWGSAPRSAESWDHWLDGEATRLDLSFVALSDGAVAGYTINAFYPDDEALTGRRDGWIHNIGVLRDHRGRGIASALIAASVDAFGSEGLTHARLQVDSANPSGAHELYRRLGFELFDSEVVHELEITAGS